MLNSLHISLLWRSLNWVARLAIKVTVAVAILMAAIIIVLRYSFLPDIEQYHSKITDSLSVAMGHPVTIARIEADWQGVRPRLSLTDVRILNDEQQTVLGLQRIDASISWMTLLTADLRFANLEIVKPELLVRRDVQGDFYLGELKLAGAGSDGQLTGWLLNQSRMVVRDALIVWVDEWREAPPLILHQVNLRVESLFDRHSFALQALPPSELSTPLDVRGEFVGSNLNDLADWSGQIFTRLDYTDVAAWKPWLDMPVELGRARGALRGWLSIDAGRVSKIVADLNLRDVTVKLTDTTPVMEITKLRGRAAWHELAEGVEFSTNKLMMQLQGGLKFEPTDIYFRTARESESAPVSTRIRANLLRLEAVAGLSRFLPMPDKLREQVNQYAPRGRISNLDVSWDGELDKPENFKVKGQFEKIALRQVGSMPGFSGLTVDIEGDKWGGNLNINARQLHLNVPGIMREPLFFNTLTGQVGWRSVRGEVSVNVDGVTVANDDLAGNMYGSYQTKAGTLGILDLTARLTRGDIRRAARYTPLIALNEKVGGWLNNALLAGHTEDLRIRIKGNLSDFPIKDDTKDVLFKIGGHAQDAVLRFSDEWPVIEDITGEFQINGNKMEIISPSASMGGARLQNVGVTLPNMTGDDLALMINGEALAETNTFLKFIQHSPVRGYIDGFTDGVKASGDGQLRLFLRIPLGRKNGSGESEDMTQRHDLNSNPVQVAGNFQIQGSDIDLGEGIPWLRNTAGVLMFTESGLRANGVSSRIFGGAAKIDVQSVEGGAVHVAIKGKSDLDSMRQNNSHPVLKYLSGGAAWDADIHLADGDVKLIVHSDLEGVDSTLPQPFDKRAGKAIPLRVEKSKPATGQEMLVIRLNNVLDMKLEREMKDGQMQISRGTVHFGLPEGKPLEGSGQRKIRKSDGVWIDGHLPVVSFQGWEGVFGNPKRSDPFPFVAGVSLSIDDLVGYGKSLGAVQVTGGPSKDGVSVQLAGDALNGVVSWLPEGFESGSKFIARLGTVHLTEGSQSSPSASKSLREEVSGDLGHEDPNQHPSAIPALDIVVDNLRIKGNPIGRLELAGHPDGDDWRMRRLNLTNPDGSLSGDGVWRAGPERTQTQLNLQLAITDAGKTLARSGYPDTVKGGKGTLTANLKWTGSPDEFKHSTLNGTLKLDTGKGRFLKMDPGAGKLLSILSLQALPSHISLDFTDVFSDGFQFDSIKGNATISNGVISTQDLNINGSAAKITMKGNVNLNNETQNLRVTILPTLGESVSLISAFAAGPAVGIGTFIVSKVLGDPLDKFVSFEYNIDGAWSNPNVVKISRDPTKPAQ